MSKSLQSAAHQLVSPSYPSGSGDHMINTSRHSESLLQVGEEGVVREIKRRRAR